MPARPANSPKQAPIRVIRQERPRLLRPFDDPHFRFEPPTDPVRRRILANLLDDCELYAGQRPWPRIPRRPDSPHPYHQLYLTFLHCDAGHGFDRELRLCLAVDR